MADPTPGATGPADRRCGDHSGPSARSPFPAPVVLAPDSVPSLRWGVIGTGIADPFVAAMHAHTAQRAVAVTARDPAKTEAFARRHGIGPCTAT